MQIRLPSALGRGETDLLCYQRYFLLVRLWCATRKPACISHLTIAAILLWGNLTKLHLTQWDYEYWLLRMLA
jgi:hypothetical protein